MTERLVLDAVTPLPPVTLSTLFPPVCDLSLWVINALADWQTGADRRTHS